MTRKSDRAQNPTPPSFPTNSKPSKKRDDWNTAERAEFERSIYQIHEGLIKNWIPQFISARFRKSLDTQQLCVEILRELIDAIWKREDGIEIDGEEARLLCWTITKRRSLNSVRNACARKRLMPSGCELRQDAIGEQPDRNRFNRPDVGASEQRGFEQ